MGGGFDSISEISYCVASTKEGGGINCALFHDDDDSCFLPLTACMSNENMEKVCQ